MVRLQGSLVQNSQEDPRSIQPFIHPRLIKGVPGTPEDSVVKSNLSPSWSFETFEPYPYERIIKKRSSKLPS